VTEVLPDWCRLRRGNSNVLLLAPHGGRRALVDPLTDHHRKVNDLHTASLTAELAERVDATAIINHGCDRNQLDLNRTGQIERRAPWFLALLSAELKRILQHHARAQILLVHGWNVAQPKCDLGVGGKEEGGVLEPLPDADLSVTDTYWGETLRALRLRCQTLGIAMVVGERYPAANKSNLLQAFTPRFANSPNPYLRELAGWAAAGCTDAVQIELGIPVRWPGPLREAFLHATSTALVDPGAALGNEPVTRQGAPAVTQDELGPVGFHFCDPTSHLTVFASMAPFGSATWGRLLLFLAGQEIVLFTGEEPGERAAVGGLSFERVGRGIDVRFSGYATRLADARLYLDLEAALAASVLTEVELELHFEPVAGGVNAQTSHGSFSGAVSVDDRRVEVAARGFSDLGAALRGPGTQLSRSHLAASFGGSEAFNLRGTHENGPLRGLVWTREQQQPRPQGRVLVDTDGDLYTPSGFRLELQGEPPVLVRPLAVMPIVRPLQDGARARITFGPARFQWSDRVGWGVYEYSRRVAAR
jgi:hypothetical protein